MREIKFRVWDTFWETMYPVQKIHLENDKASAYCYTDWGGESCLVEGVGSIMQYTGVNDIGGEEIYERDILRDKFGEYYLVKLVDGEFVAEADGKMYDLEDVAGIAGIISNIYENPELVNLLDQEIEDLKEALTEAFVKWGRETGNSYWIEIPIKGTERLYDLQTGKPI